MKVKYMGTDVHLVIPLKKGETLEQAEDRMIDALLKNNMTVIGWKKPEITEYDYERCCEYCKNYGHSDKENPCASCDTNYSAYEPAEGFDYDNE